VTSPIVPLADRFWEKVKKSDGCWEWRGAKNKHGYGNLKYQGKYLGAHRVSWELTNGLLPKGVSVLHKCDNPSCVRPDHLFLGDHGTNARDMVAKGRSRMQAQPETVLRGTQQNQAKLTDEKVREIRRLVARGVLTKKDIAAMYGVSDSLISCVTNGRNWTHVQEEP
jgi:hypothetical protein